MENNQKIILDLKKGKTTSFKDIYFLYYDKLFHICKKFNFKVFTPQDFIQETFFTFRIGFSLNDKWFLKRKYN